MSLIRHIITHKEAFSVDIVRPTSLTEIMMDTKNAPAAGRVERCFFCEQQLSDPGSAVPVLLLGSFSRAKWQGAV
jgi:hypothetical protein